MLTRSHRQEGRSMTQAVSLEGVSKVYKGNSTVAVDGVTIAVASGEFTAGMGPSGSGKSTLLNLIAGLDRATGGNVTVDGHDLTRMSEGGLARYRRSSVGVIFQFFNLLANVNVLDNVLLPAELAGVRNPRPRALDLLDRLGMASRRNQFPARLSGGERQRVAVARALINSPALLLADEPTGALDSQNGEQVIDMLLDLNRGGQTIILVTHDARLAARCSRRVVGLIDGRMISDSVAATGHAGDPPSLAVGLGAF
jgi:putative ABC transport system ATP-binding protein